MGVHKNIGYDKFPEQGSFLGVRVLVCFNYDTTNCIGGVVVRDDLEDPGNTIIQLDDGRYILTTECQFSIA